MISDLSGTPICDMIISLFYLVYYIYSEHAITDVKQ